VEARPKHIFKPSKGFTFYLCIAVGLGFLVGSYFVLAKTFKQQYPQLFEILGGVAMILFGIYCIYYYSNRKIIYVYEDSVVFKSGLIIKKIKLRLDEIESWAELKKTSKHGSWDELYIFTASEKYSFASSNYDDYYTFKDKITKNKHRNNEYEKKSDNKNVWILALVIFLLGLFLLPLGLKPLLLPNSDVSSVQLVKTNQIVIDGIKIKKSGRHSHNIELKFNEFPEFDFKVSGDAFDAMYAENFVDEVHLGDTLTVSVPKDEYGKKMAKTIPLTFWDKYVNYYDIKVYEISHRNTSYLTLNDFAQEEGSRTKSNARIGSIIGIILVGISIFIYIKRKKIAAA
jgi:hypothetical protein